MKITELAIRMGMNPASGRVTLSRLERGETKNPGADLIVSVARALGVPAGVLLSDPPSYLQGVGAVAPDEAHFLGEVLQSYRARSKK